MAFKGDIPKGSKVEAELTVSNTAGGTALLTIGFSDDDGGEDAQSVRIAPGGRDSRAVQTGNAEGLVKVVVDFNSNTDTGRLVVRVNGKVRNDESITGDTPWTYSLT